jgi:hypothetical protein
MALSLFALPRLPSGDLSAYVALHPLPIKDVIQETYSQAIRQVLQLWRYHTWALASVLLAFFSCRH